MERGPGAVVVDLTSSRCAISALVQHRASLGEAWRSSEVDRRGRVCNQQCSWKGQFIHAGSARRLIWQATVLAGTAEDPKLRDSVVKVDERGIDEACGCYYTCMGSSALPRLGASSSECKSRRSSSRLRGEE